MAERWLIGIRVLSSLTAGAFLGLSLKKLVENIPQPIFIVLFLTALFVLIILEVSKKRYVKTVIEATRLSTDEVRARSARQGLVVFLPLYQKFGPPAVNISDALENDDYTALGLLDNNATNFGHATLAIQTHLPKLKHCWIITTRSQNQPQKSSHNFLKVYQKFLNDHITKGAVSLHTSLSIDIDEESQVCKLTADAVQSIYEEARRKPIKLKPSQIIVDITPGTKSMTAGAVLGALAKEREIQIIPSQFEPGSGRTKTGDPVMIHYESKLQTE